MYGEDPRTGAGGANVITHGLFNFALPSVFPALPGGRQMRVSWRQSLRFGSNRAGQVIEDFGCEANVDVSLTANDILNGNQDQILKITKDLAQRSTRRRFASTVRPSQLEQTVVLTNSNRSYSLTVTNTRKVRLEVDGAVVSETLVRAGEKPKTVTIDLPASLPIGQLAAVAFKGVSGGGRTLWNVRRQVVVLNDPLVIDASGFQIDFGTATSVAPFTVLNQNAPADGWNLVTPFLQVGYNPQYTDNVDTDAVLSFGPDFGSVPTAQVSFDMEYDTEANFDFIDVFVTDAEGNRQTLLRDSGSQPLTSYNFDISSFAGRSNVTLHFRFTSDVFITAPGVRIQAGLGDSVTIPSNPMAPWCAIGFPRLPSFSKLFFAPWRRLLVGASRPMNIFARTLLFFLFASLVACGGRFGG